VAQAVECFLCKCKILSSIPTPQTYQKTKQNNNNNKKKPKPAKDQRIGLNVKNSWVHISIWREKSLWSLQMLLRKESSFYSAFPIQTIFHDDGKNSLL
jgi:hypothetical protein